MAVDQLSAALAAGADCRHALVDALLEDGCPLQAEAVRVPLLPFIWRNREVRLVDGNFWLSARGRHDDWDVCPDQPGEGMSVAGNPGERIREIQPVNELFLRLCCGSRNYLLVGDDFMSTARIVEEPAHGILYWVVNDALPR